MAADQAWELLTCYGIPVARYRCAGSVDECLAAGDEIGYPVVLKVDAEGIVHKTESGGVVIDQHPPGPSNLSGQIGYIMNLVTIPSHRRRGIAQRVMRAMMKWLAERDIHRVTLHATEEGRPLYQELGFVDNNEMRLKAKEN